MRLNWVLVSTMVLFCTGSAFAQPEPVPTPTPNLEDVRLLEDVPNYAEALVHQWRKGVGPIGESAERDWENYGRLLDRGTPRPLSLSDCILLALRHNTRLQVERLGPLSARVGVRSARSIFDPEFFADIGKERSVVPSDNFFFYHGVLEQNFRANVGLRKVLLTGGRIKLSWGNRRHRTNSTIQGLDPDYITDLSFSISQPLLRDFGLRYATILVRVAETTELQALRAYEASVAQTVESVEDAYWRLVQAIENVKVQEKSLAAAQELERQNRGKFEVGTLPRTAVLEAQTVVAQRRALLIRVKNSVTIARDALRALLNVPADDPDVLLLVEPGELPSVEPLKFDMESSLKCAREHRPELQAAQLNVHAKALALKAAENQLLPRLDAVAAIGTHGLAGDGVDPNSVIQFPGMHSSGFEGSYGDALKMLTDGRYYGYSIGVKLQVPLGNASARARYAAARVNLERARLNFHAVQQQVTLEIKSAVTNL